MSATPAVPAEAGAATPPVSDVAGPDRSLREVQRRAVAVLSLMQVVGGVGVASGIAVNGLLAQDISGSTALSGMAQTMAVLGAALLAVPLARLAQRRGRRPALALGYLVAVVGAALSIVAGVSGSFPLLLLAAALFGGGTASGLQSRYGAIDAAEPARKGRALAVVMWAGTLGSVLGPNLSEAGGRVGTSLGLPLLTGPFLFSVVAFTLAALTSLLWLRPDPLLAAHAARARAAMAAAPTGPSASIGTGLRHAVGIARRSPGARLGLLAVGSGHAVMVAVMVMTPVHLRGDGATLRIVGLVISAHIAGMYAASPVMGWVADRFGRIAGILIGQVLLAWALVLAGTAPSHAHLQLGVGLALLGLGWSAAVVAGSTLVSESVPAAVRPTVQGLSDLVMGLVAAIAGLLAGPVLAARGYPALALVAGVLLLPTTLAALGHQLTRRARVTSSDGAAQ
jgi:MFS family permease